MMMAVLDPRIRRRRRRGRVFGAAMAAGLLLLACGAWAQTQGRYELLVVDARTGTVLSRARSEDVRLPPVVRRAGEAALRKGLSEAGKGLREGLRAVAGPDPAAPISLAGGPPAAPPLRIVVTDAWAEPGAVFPPVEDSGGLDPG